MRLRIVTAAFAALVAVPVFAADDTSTTTSPAAQAIGPSGPDAAAQTTSPAPAKAPAAAETTPEATAASGTDKCDAALSYCLAGVGTNNTTVFEEAGDAKTGLSSRTGMLCNANSDSSNPGVFVTKGKTGAWSDSPLQIAPGQCVSITASGLELRMMNPTAPWNAIWVTVSTAAPAAKKVAAVHHRPKKQKTAAQQPAQQPQQQQQPDLTFQPVIP